MKPLNVILLVVGAALAGGLAVKMSQPPPIAIAPIAPTPVAVPASPRVAVPSNAAVTPPPAVLRSYPPRAKPSPFSEPAAQAPAPARPLL